MAFRGISLKTQETNSPGCRKRYKLVDPFHFPLKNDIVSFDIFPPASSATKLLSQPLWRTKIDNVTVLDPRVLQGATEMILRKTRFPAKRNLANVHDDLDLA